MAHFVTGLQPALVESAHRSHQGHMTPGHQGHAMPAHQGHVPPMHQGTHHHGSHSYLREKKHPATSEHPQVQNTGERAEVKTQYRNDTLLM
ncbi:hypothetical protein RUM43_001365 [Polyplax serrata]|uniref:Uncharacterized protein n=1 Tax=Polyplax serrata TaxID=468196 RepID=A0AAN8SEP3_POLSC